jgi:hypothetical protein
MWKLWRTAQQSHSRPSSLVCIQNKLAAYLFDNAVVFFGTAVENALQERVNLGSPSHPNWESKYTLSELLESDFIIQMDETPRKMKKIGKGSTGIAQVLALADQGTGGIKKWVYDPNAVAGEPNV